MTQLEAKEAARAAKTHNATPLYDQVMASRTTAPRQVESWLDEEPVLAQARAVVKQVEARKWTITDPTDAWYGLSDEAIATAIATYEMATDSRF
jgi:hypothetical protein